MIIYIMLSKNDDCTELEKEIQNKIIKYLKDNIYGKLKYKFIFNPKHIVEKNIYLITQNDFVLWHPNIAANNLSLVKKYNNSVVILLTKTILLQKISKRNPINENIAINHGFKLLYIEPNYDDVTNDEYKLVISENDYVISIEKIIETIKKQYNE